MLKKMYWVLILQSLGLTLVVSAASAVGVITASGETGMLLSQIAAFLLTGGYFTYYVRKNKLKILRKSFILSKKTFAILIFIFGVISIQPLIFGFQNEISFSTILLIAIQMLLVGYSEELLFRGIFWAKMNSTTLRIYVLFSATVFGILHLATGINPEAVFLLVILQVIHAFLLGIVFAVLYYYTQNIYVLIFFHAAFNFFASVSKAGTINQNILTVFILSLLYLAALFCFYICKKKRAFSK